MTDFKFYQHLFESLPLEQALKLLESREATPLPVGFWAISAARKVYGWQNVRAIAKTRLDPDSFRLLDR